MNNMKNKNLCKNCGHEIEDAKSEEGKELLHAYKYKCIHLAVACE